MLTIEAKFPDSGWLVTMIPDLREGEEDGVELLLNQPFLQHSLKPNKNWFRVSEFHLGDEDDVLRVTYKESEVEKKKLVFLRLSYISPNEKERHCVLTDIVLKFFLPSVRDLAKIVQSKIFKYYLFRIMSREWSEWDQAKYRLTLAEISLHDQVMVLEFEHVGEEK